MKAADKLIVALDFDTKDRALNLAEALRHDVKIFKVGFELFSSCGPSIIGDIKKMGCNIFLDLKFHDIPNTVSKAAVAITSLGAFMFNVHALGGYEMMARTAEKVRKDAEKLDIAPPRILAVTILTSMDENALKKVGINDTIGTAVLRLARLAKDAGLDGVVASALEIKAIRRELGNEFLIVTPGVRPVWAAAGDQKRVATPKEAIEAGASFIVVGRPITDAPDPREAAKKILEEIK
jgi:orotidine-5'-phosphate decarboxylase